MIRILIFIIASILSTALFKSIDIEDYSPEITCENKNFQLITHKGTFNSYLHSEFEYIKWN